MSVSDPFRMPWSLKCLNLMRWVREYWLSWGLLGAIYSVTATILLQAVAGAAFRIEPPFVLVWVILCAALLIPAFIELIPFGVPLPLGRMRRAGIGSLYIRHDLRRVATWTGVILVSVSGSLFIESGSAARLYWVPVVLIPVQRALYSFRYWKGIVSEFRPESGAVSLLASLLGSQLIQFGVAWVALGLTVLDIASWWELWFRMGAGGIGAVVAGSAVAFEGDSGRPWIVNFMSISAGILAGYLSMEWPLVLIGVLYFSNQIVRGAVNRLKSAEIFHEDIVIP